MLTNRSKWKPTAPGGGQIPVLFPRPRFKKKHVNEQISLITIITYETYDSLCVMSLHKHNTASVAEWLDRRFK
jgi:hypothetical protein